MDDIAATQINPLEYDFTKLQPFIGPSTCLHASDEHVGCNTGEVRIEFVWIVTVKVKHHDQI